MLLVVGTGVLGCPIVVFSQKQALFINRILPYGGGLLLAAKNSDCFNVKTNQNTLFSVCKDFFSPNASFFLDKRPVL